MDRASRVLRAARVVGLVSLFLLVAVAQARAAFPGRNGLLVVEPAIGNGLIVVGADGAHPQQICAVAAQCDRARDPVWSPDGAEIAFSSSQAPGSNARGPQPYVIYPDGSCLACPVPAVWLAAYDETTWDPNLAPRFLPGGRLAVSIDSQAQQLGAIRTDGIGFEPFKIGDSWRQAAWSQTGQLAAVRLVRHKPEVFVVDPFTGSARRLTHSGASSPNWSPDGLRLAVVHRGWIELIGAHGGRMQRVTRGRAPAWAPDGQELAFIGAHQRLFVIAARGGQPRPVGQIRAESVDWQPVTGQQRNPCQVPAGSTVLAALPSATVTIDEASASQYPGSSPAFSVLGCLTSDGRGRLLESMRPADYNEALALGPVAVAGNYAAVVNEGNNPHYGGSWASVAVFDLRTGTAVVDRGGESSPGPYGGIDQLVLGPDAVTAALAAGETCGGVGVSPCTPVEQIVANDSSGTHVLDSVSSGSGHLSGLALSGDTLTWSHAGTPESAQLNGP
jgi:WD40-like Beta Propeller Repeat